MTGAGVCTGTTTGATTTGGATITGGGGGTGTGGAPIVSASATSPTPGPVNFTVESFGFVTVNVSAHRSPVTVHPSRSIARNGSTWSGCSYCQRLLQCALRFVRESRVAWNSGSHSERYVLIPKPWTLQTESHTCPVVSHCVASETVYPSTRRSLRVAALAVPASVRKSATTSTAKVRFMVQDLLVGRAAAPDVDASRGHSVVGRRTYQNAWAS